LRGFTYFAILLSSPPFAMPRSKPNCLSSTPSPSFTPSASRCASYGTAMKDADARPSAARRAYGVYHRVSSCSKRRESHVARLIRTVAKMLCMTRVVCNWLDRKSFDVTYCGNEALKQGVRER
jgi:hypothetical protein